VPNARKGYKLTLWVSAMTEAGLADVHGLLQLDGADPIPFCQLKGVQNPLARALQEAHLAVQRVRAKPPRMSGPPVAPQAASRPQPPAAPGAAASPPEAGGPQRAPATPKTPAASAPPTRRDPIAQGSLF
jgi:hypothetical protein